MQNKVLETIEKYNLINCGDSVTVALSGGADSVALLLVLLKLKDKLKINISACHVNHNLRGDEAKRDEDFCFALCEQKNVRLFIKSVDVLGYAKNHSVSIELAARELRYEALSEVGKDGKIATAHTLSDSVETSLFNFARGTGLRGLMGITPCRDNVIRPLSFVGREEIESFLAGESQNFVNDSTNFKNEFARNKIRNKVIPVLKEINPSLEQNFSNFREILNEENDFLQKQGCDALNCCRLKNNRIDAVRLAKYDMAIIKRALIAFFNENHLSVDYNKLKYISVNLNKSGAVQVDSQNIVFIKQGILYLSGAIEKKLLQKEVVLNAQKLTTVFFGNKTIEFIPINGEETKLFVNSKEKAFKYCLDCDRINFTVNLRNRLDGDKAELFGRGVTKSLKKLMNEEKWTPRERCEAVVMACGDNIIFIEGFGVCEKAAISANTKNAVKIKITAEE